MPTKFYLAPETAISFKASGGDVTFTPTSVGTGAGRISAQWDRGSGSKPGRYKWRAVTKAASALTVGNQLEIYFATGNGTNIDGNQSTSDAAFSATDKRRNLQYVGVIVADSTSAGETQVASGVSWIYDRYASLVWWNAFGVSLSSTATDHSFELIPLPDESQ